MKSFCAKCLLAAASHMCSWLACFLVVASCAAQTESKSSQAGEPEEWVQLFNGQDLDGWTPKIRGAALGENYGDVFRVEDGLLKVGYENYTSFDQRFGHLFYKEKYSHYVIRAEYRFTGEQCAGGPGWARRNSGIMVHCQDPRSMKLEQNFPVSIEVQLLGGYGEPGEMKRPTGNLCTPGTHVEMDGALFTRHCTNSTSPTFFGDEWVTIEVEVRGNEIIRHRINGEVVLEYQRPQLDPNDSDAKPLILDGKLELKQGYISLQSESHPVEFRKVELRVLSND